MGEYKFHFDSLEITIPKTRSHGQDKAPATKIPRGQIQIIKASLAALIATEAQESQSLVLYFHVMLDCGT